MSVHSGTWCWGHYQDIRTIFLFAAISFFNELQDNMYSFYVQGLSCGDPGPVQNTSYTGGYLYGDVVKYECINGYYMKEKHDGILCGSNQTWIGDKPECLSNNLYFKVHNLQQKN